MTGPRSTCSTAFQVLLPLNQTYGTLPSFVHRYGFGVGGEYPMAASSSTERAAANPDLQMYRGRQVILVFSGQVIVDTSSSKGETLICFVGVQYVGEDIKQIVPLIERCNNKMHHCSATLNQSFAHDLLKQHTTKPTYGFKQTSPNSARSECSSKRFDW